MIPTADQDLADLINFDYHDHDRARCRAARLYVELLNMSPADRARHDGSIAEFAPSLDDDELAGDHPEPTEPDPVETPIVTEPHPTERPEYGVEVTLDDLDPGDEE
jgi:hypothetical protein